MNNRGEKVLKKYSDGLSIVLSATILFCSVIPLYIIAHYNYPTSDDFAYTSSIYWGIREGLNVSQILKAACETAIRYYLTWQGRYFDDFVSALGIGSAVPGLYWIGTYFVLTLFVVASIWFVRSISYKVCGFDSHISWIVAIWFTTVQIWYVPHAVEAFYWYVGATGYTMTHAFTLLLVSAMIGFYKTDDKLARMIYGFLSILLTFMIAGSNYASALLLAELLVVAIMVCIIHKKKCIFLQVVFAEYLCCFGCNIFSPGNHARMGNVESLGVLGSITASLKQAAVFCKEWFHIPVFLFLVFVVFLSCNQIRKMHYDFRLPGMVSIVSFCLLASILTPPFYAGATWGPGRLINIEYYCYYVFLCGNILYWIGWITHKRQNKQRKVVLKIRELPTYIIVMTMCVAFFICFKFYGLQSVNSTSALLSLLKGEAKQYRLEQEARWDLYEDETVKNVEVTAFSSRPHVLYYDDIQLDKTDWRNVAVATFFKKESVRIIE